MKKIILALTVLSLAACSAEQQTKNNDRKQIEGVTAYVDPNGNFVTTYVDPETGCEYLVYASTQKAGMTVRLDSDGKPKGCRDA